MARAGLDKNIIVGCAAQMANEIGLENVTLKLIAKEFGVQTPSLYNHIKSLDDLKKQLEDARAANQRNKQTEKEGN